MRLVLRTERNFSVISAASLSTSLAGARDEARGCSMVGGLCGVVEGSRRGRAWSADVGVSRLRNWHCTAPGRWSMSVRVQAQQRRATKRRAGYFCMQTSAPVGAGAVLQRQYAQDDVVRSREIGSRAARVRRDGG